MNYAEIKPYDIANGEGVRVSLFVSGCTRHCKNCFNQMTWDFSYGKRFTEETEASIFHMLAPDYIAGLSLLGGEPFEPQNQRALTPFLQKLKKNFPKKTIWCYTGYTYENGSLKEEHARTEVVETMLSLLDALVDGRFIEALKDIRLLFRGSSNQRIIDVQQSLKHGNVVLYLT